MDGVAERVEDRGVISGNRRVQFPNVRFGNFYVVGKCSIGIDSDDFYLLANVRLARTALQTLTAVHMHLRRNEIAFSYARDLASNGSHSATKFMTGNERGTNAFLCPCVPLVDVQVSAANRSHFH